VSARAAERAAVLLLAAGTVGLAWALALLASPAWAGEAGDASAARATLAKARVVRGSSHAADERFDTLVAGLAAGVGAGTPAEIAADLDHIATARALERALGRRTPATERSVDGALARASGALAARSTARPLLDVSAGGGRARYAAASLAAALLLIAAGSALAARRLAARRVELVAVARRLGVPVSRALDGSLVEEVTLYALTRGGAAAREAGRARVRPEGAPRVPGPGERPSHDAAHHASPALAALPPAPPTSARLLLDVVPLSKGADD
jgi:hypothetical protein